MIRVHSATGYHSLFRYWTKIVNYPTCGIKLTSFPWTADGKCRHRQGLKQQLKADHQTTRRTVATRTLRNVPLYLTLAQINRRQYSPGIYAR